MSDFSEVIPNIFIGNAAAARDPKFFNQHKISHVINVTEKEPNHFEQKIDDLRQSKVVYLHLPVSDKCSSTLSAYFAQTNAFIKDCLSSETNALLIHCKCGVSRSSTVLLAFLVQVRGMTLSNALNLVRKKRRRIRPNIGFFLQLLQVEKDTHGSVGSGTWVPSIYPHVYCEMPEQTWLLMMKINKPDELPGQISEKQFKLLAKMAFRGRKKRKR